MIGCNLMLSSGIILISGCSKSPERSNATATAANAPQAELPPLSSNLWQELQLIPDRSAESDPMRRPLVLSESGTNRQHWALRALERGYAATGKTNAAWDGAVRESFGGYALYSRGYDYDGVRVMSNGVARAMQAGCNDPMIHYLRTRYVLGKVSADWMSYAAEMVRISLELSRSEYHPAFKLSADLRALEAVKTADKRQPHGTLIAAAIAHFQDLARDTNAPSQEIFDGLRLLYDANQARGYVDMVMSKVEPALTTYWSREAAYSAFQGETELVRAWDSRGRGYADTVTPEGAAAFVKHLGLAEKFLDQAWRLGSSNSYTAYLMMRLELGQGKGRSRMEDWFHQAMKMDPGYFEAAQLMSFYLEPRWYGSEAEALTFGRSCVTSTNWAGQVPLVLPALHRSLAGYKKQTNSPEYWHRPKVWEDVRSAYETFFQRNPQEADYRAEYAQMAFLCGKYPVFLQQAALFTTGTNVDYFGGQAKWEEMLKTASASLRGGR